MTAAFARQIRSWRYPAPHDFYDLDADQDDLAELLDERTWPGACFAVIDPTAALVGFFMYGIENTTATLGLGLRPDLTGVGLGREFVAAGLAFGAEELGISSYRLAVAEFNTRAIRVYRGLGFSETARFTQDTNGGRHRFVTMELSAAPPATARTPRRTRLPQRRSPGSRTSG